MLLADRTSCTAAFLLLPQPEERVLQHPARAARKAVGCAARNAHGQPRRCRRANSRCASQRSSNLARGRLRPRPWRQRPPLPPPLPGPPSPQRPAPPRSTSCAPRPAPWPATGRGRPPSRNVCAGAQAADLVGAGAVGLAAAQAFRSQLPQDAAKYVRLNALPRPVRARRNRFFVTISLFRGGFPNGLYST